MHVAAASVTPGFYPGHFYRGDRFIPATGPVYDCGARATIGNSGHTTGLTFSLSTAARGGTAGEWSRRKKRQILVRGFLHVL